MNGMQKVLVVDNGERRPDRAFSAELASLGYASVTAHVEAAEDVLSLLPGLSAVILQMPRQATWSERRQFLELASRLRRKLAASGIPIIISGGESGTATALHNALNARAVAAPNL